MTSTKSVRRCILHPFYQGEVLEAGCDEVGRGALAGPVVAAAVVWPKGLYSACVRDSKALNSTQRADAELYISAHATDWALGQASVEEIDRYNIVEASFLAMHRAIENLSVRPELLLIDGHKFKPYPGIAHCCLVKGDALYTSIAAASIMAKRYRDQSMHILSTHHPMYRWGQNVGYPTAAHRLAIAQHGRTPYHRKTFACS